MNQPWDAEFNVTPAVAQHLIDSQFPELDTSVIELLGTGWDNVAYLVDHDKVFRFPQRELGGWTMECELEILPQLKSKLPLPITIPEWIGKPQGEYSWPFAGYRFIAGTPAGAMPLTDKQRGGIASDLGRFLKALHGLTDHQTITGPKDEIGRLDIEKRSKQARNHLEFMVSHRLLEERHAARLFDFIKKFDGFTYQPKQVVVHGDLYSLHLLLDQTDQLCGVIDFGDTHLGHPALDLACVWSFLPVESHPQFFEAYGEIDFETQQLAQFRCLQHSGIMVKFAFDTQNDLLLQNSLFPFNRFAI